VALARTPGEGLACEFGDQRSVDHRTAHGGNCAVDTCPRSAWQWRWHCTAVTSRGALVHRPQYLRERLYRFRRERPCRSIAVALPENSKVGNGSRLCENAKFRYRALAASAFGQPIRPRWVVTSVVWPVWAPPGAGRSGRYCGQPRVHVYLRARSGRPSDSEADEAFRQGSANCGHPMKS